MAAIRSATRLLHRRPAIAPRALFCCNASAATGAGHVSRCLALAEELNAAGWVVNFAVGADTLSIMPRLADGGLLIAEAPEFGSHEPDALHRQFPGGVDLLVVDDYSRDVAFEQACRAFARRILVIDDGTGRKHDCDVLLDSGATEAARYSGLVPEHASMLSARPMRCLGRTSWRRVVGRSRAATAVR
jgi:UDP-2,4-diacetamido-2,4,6-trideoxy-beta-L-altropyranose hydrolase